MKTAAGKPGDPPGGARTGAPKGNINAARDKGFTSAMKRAQAAARKGRARRRAECLKQARATIAEVGLSDSPLGERTAQRIAHVEAEILELELIVKRVGRTRRDGSLSPAYTRMLQLIETDRFELRNLVDRFAELQRGVTPPGDVERVVVFADGRAVEDRADASALGSGEEIAPADGSPVVSEAIVAPGPSYAVGAPIAIETKPAGACTPGCDCLRCRRRKELSEVLFRW